jgi:putative FmdB family regulatory protein
MPLYEYRCKSCEHTFEAIQKFSDRPLRKCPECSGRLEKLISRTAFVLKGGGWYADDYGRRSSPKKSPGKSDSKPAGSKKSD